MYLPHTFTDTNTCIQNKEKVILSLKKGGGLWWQKPVRSEKTQFRRQRQDSSKCKGNLACIKETLSQRQTKTKAQQDQKHLYWHRFKYPALKYIWVQLDSPQHLLLSKCKSDYKDKNITRYQLVESQLFVVETASHMYPRLVRNYLCSQRQLNLLFSCFLSISAGKDRYLLPCLVYINPRHHDAEQTFYWVHPPSR